MLHLRSEGQIAPVNCGYAYVVGLGGRLRALASVSFLGDLLALGGRSNAEL
jgi:hypothetical protein